MKKIRTEKEKDGKDVEDVKYEEDEDCRTWEGYKDKFRRFSEGVQFDFKSAFSNMVDRVIRSISLEGGVLPIRPVILAGDDVCLVTHGKIGLACARMLLEELSQLQNEADGEYYAACAGIAIVHQKYPFHRAYELSEELCSEAKRYGAKLNENGKTSAMDWHIEFGKMKDSLSELRQDYITEDGNQLLLRPVKVLSLDDPKPKDSDSKDSDSQKAPDSQKPKPPVERTYQFFSSLCAALQGESGRTARGKLKNLRTAMKQGETESNFYLHDKEIQDLLYHAFDAEFRSDVDQMDQFKEIIYQGKTFRHEAFRQLSGEEKKRCLFFDAIEMVDHWVSLEVKA